MPPITRELLRKRAEHNEGIISTLEELTLHQEEIEKIEVVGTVCRQLKILYLQNNIIGKIEGLHHLKQLEYLNLAMNNIQKIEGLRSCEFLNKLDLTLNFVDFDELEASVAHLQPLTMLRELYMMGNPAQADWPGFNRFVIASLPQLEWLDGKQISRSDRILASQEYATLLAELRPLADAKRAEKAAKQAEREAARLAAEAADDEEDSSDDEEDDEQCEGAVLDARHSSKKKKKKKKKQTEEEEWDANEETEHSPEERVRMQRQTAREKKEKEDREKEMQPRKRDYDAEHAEAVAKAREREANGSEVRQCNDGKLDFKFDEWTRPGEIILTVGVPRYMDSSLMDVDVHPWYVSIVVKNKTLRLKWPEEVIAAKAKAQRSKTTGELVVTAPAQDPSSAVRARRERQKHKEENAGAAAAAKAEAEKAATAARGGPKLLDQMLAESQAAAVDIHNIVPKGKKGQAGEKENDGPLMQSAADTGGGSGAKKVPLITAIGESEDKEDHGEALDSPGARERQAVPPSSSTAAAAPATAPATSAAPRQTRPSPAMQKAVSCAAPPPPLF